MGLALMAYTILSTPQLSLASAPKLKAALLCRLGLLGHERSGRLGNTLARIEEQVRDGTAYDGGNTQ